MALTLEDLTFDNRFTEDLPGDPMDLNRPRQVHHAAYSRVAPTPTSSPRLLAHSAEVLADLGLSPKVFETDEFLRVFSGNATIDAMEPYAACYGGHQFGNWAGQLGDGRAIALGEIVTDADVRHTLQLKGAGPTPYSRTADGLAVLRSSAREFLCSEAMFHLGVPTTRALSLATTGDHVMRDMFYDGNPEREQGAVVCRVAPSFIRFGNFELPMSRDDGDLLRALADHTISLHFPNIADGRTTGFTADDYVTWFAEVARRTADMIVHWQRVGFVHGVMNTDNMSIHGLTIDYGPYGWLEDYDPGWTPNTTDRQFKRYRFGAQPHIGQWNITQLANAIYPLVGDIEPLQEALTAYVDVFNHDWPRMMAAKLGIAEFDEARDPDLIHDLLEHLPTIETDMTVFFRCLADVSTSTDASDDERLAALADADYDPGQRTGDARELLAAWLRDWASRVGEAGRSDVDRAAAMNAVNPKFVLRNYLAQLAIDEADKGDPALIGELLDVLRRPYDEQPDKERFAEKRPEWARVRPGCSMLSCSS
ncbi:MAG: YdiU family protein [Acidimicrobiales bacterium]|nr:YdiU family protein [Acidimicrobiales bacterium]